MKDWRLVRESTALGAKSTDARRRKRRIQGSFKASWAVMRDEGLKASIFATSSFAADDTFSQPLSRKQR
ncbi:MAG: hypothetical protein P4M11_04750 [Candidatus Pacebacteria bacterium]|nr:hypothetical protein [Candidatus Paceibacterota bacterium]